MPQVWTSFFCRSKSNIIYCFICSRWSVCERLLNAAKGDSDWYDEREAMLRMYLLEMVEFCKCKGGLADSFRFFGIFSPQCTTWGCLSLIFRNTPHNWSPMWKYARDSRERPEKVNWIEVEGKTFLGWLVLRELLDVVSPSFVMRWQQIVLCSIWHHRNSRLMFAEVLGALFAASAAPAVSLWLAFDAGRFVNQYAAAREALFLHCQLAP